MASGGAIGFLIFYTVFLSLTVYITDAMGINVISANIPTEIGAPSDPLTGFATYITKFFFLAFAQVQPGYELLGLFTFGLTVAVGYIILKSLPFT